MRLKEIAKGISHCLAATIVCVIPHTGFAAQGDGKLTDLPLFLGSGADPNIMFLLDSSGSMSGSKNQQLKQATSSLVNTLFADGDKVNLGLARFSNQIPGVGSLGARMLAEIKPITDTAHRNNLLREIRSIPANGSTPLATALWQIGGYFTLGFNGNLRLHDSEISEQSAPVRSIGTSGAVFSNTWSGIKPVNGPIEKEKWCARNIITLLTDGAPTSDSHIDPTLRIWDYDNDGDPAPPGNFTISGSGYLDDIAAMLDDVDMRPDVRRLDKDGNDVGPIKNKITTHVIAFGSFLNNDRTVQRLLNDTRDNVENGLLLTASGSNQLLEAFKKIINSAIQQNGTGSSVSFNTDTVIAGETQIFQTVFNTTNWNGNLVARTLDKDGIPVLKCSKGCWNAGEILSTRSAASRNIITSNGRTGMPFQSGSFFSLSNTQKADISAAARAAGVSTGSVIDYLRGDDRNEGGGLGQLRKRTGKLGDIIHSDPIFYGKPVMPWKNTAPFPTQAGKTYGEYVGAQANRTGMVYVGANDGMLHGFNADTGKEEFAFMPESIFSTAAEDGIHYLTSQVYFHKGYVDNTPEVTDAYVNGKWRTVLVGTLRKGGKAIFGLDVTNPTGFNSRNVMFEFKHPSLGFTYSTPTIAMSNVKGSDGENRWIAVFGNGYESGSGSKVFVVFLDNGETRVLSGGTGTKNGMAKPALIDLDFNGTVDRLYAGDMDGDLYSFDISAEASNKWSNGLRLYNGPNDQPFTKKPTVAKHPSQLTNGNGVNRLVYAGTGAFLSKGDDDDTSSQSFVAVWDNTEKDGTLSSNISRNQLQTITTSEVTGEFAETARVFNDISIDWASKKGWVVDLPDIKERATNPPAVVGGFVFFNSIVPDNTVPCVAGGFGWLYSLNLENGSSPKAPLFDINFDGKIDAGDQVSVVGGTPNTTPGGLKFENGLPRESKFVGTVRITPGTGGVDNKFDDDGNILPPGVDIEPGTGDSDGTVNNGDNGGGTVTDPFVIPKQPGRLTWKEVR
ncbi:MAG: VWA domain-containing protein [Methylococcales bacterium]|jgi:type IV pilus assembly protein PilY1|nr:VWA domain-containing protein [Methylococcales bacterium]MBT7444288.1 VWA domain-containing protein [Methylococcales bacterium]